MPGVRYAVIHDLAAEMNITHMISLDTATTLLHTDNIESQTFRDNNILLPILILLASIATPEMMVTAIYAGCRAIAGCRAALPLKPYYYASYDTTPFATKNAAGYTWRYCWRWQI